MNHNTSPSSIERKKGLRNKIAAFLAGSLALASIHSPAEAVAKSSSASKTVKKSSKTNPNLLTREQLAVTKLANPTIHSGGKAKSVIGLPRELASYPGYTVKDLNYSHQILNVVPEAAVVQFVDFPVPGREEVVKATLISSKACTPDGEPAVYSRITSYSSPDTLGSSYFAFENDAFPTDNESQIGSNSLRINNAPMDWDGQMLAMPDTQATFITHINNVEPITGAYVSYVDSQKNRSDKYSVPIRDLTKVLGSFTCADLINPVRINDSTQYMLPKTSLDIMNGAGYTADVNFAHTLIKARLQASVFVANIPKAN